jgi:hypothetical protein
MHSIYDLQEKYNQVRNSGLLINEAKPFGVMSKLKNFLTLDKGTRQAKAHSQSIINTWYDGFKQTLANRGRTESNATYADLLNYLSQIAKANETNSALYSELKAKAGANLNQPFQPSRDLPSTFAKIIYQVDEYMAANAGQTQPSAPEAPQAPEEPALATSRPPRSRRQSKKEREDEIRKQTADSIIAALRSIPGININNANINQVADVATAAVQQAAGLNTKKETKSTGRGTRKKSTVSTQPAPGTQVSTT